MADFKDHTTHVLIGPFDEPISLATEALNITYLATTDVSSKNLNSTFQLLPSLEDFSEAILDLVKKYDWKDVSIFFDNNKGMGVDEVSRCAHNTVNPYCRCLH